MLLGAILAVICACIAQGIDVDSIAVLASPEAIAAVEARVAEKRWSPINASRLLNAVRMLHRAVLNHCPELVGIRARHWGAQPRINKWHRVFPSGDYIEGAYILGAISRVLGDNGRRRGLTLSRDAGLLAFEAEAALRLGEIRRANVGDVRRQCTPAGKPFLEVDVKMTKVHRDRIARIFDPRTIELMAPLLDAAPEAPLARTVEGDRLTYVALGYVLARTGALAVGERAGANNLRLAVVHGNYTEEERRKRLAHSKGSATTASYVPPRPLFGIGLIHAASAATAKAKSSVFPVAGRGLAACTWPS